MTARIDRIETTRLDIPLLQPIAMAFGTVRIQHVVLVRLTDSDGATGVGEASILGGPHWSDESAEGVKAAIDLYIAPNLRGRPLDGLEGLAARLASLVRGNAAARHAVEMAAADLMGRRLGISVADLFGGRVHDRLPVAWTLSTGSLEGDLEEGERALAERGHRRFKIKLGAGSVRQDVERAEAIVEAFLGRASVIADVNQGWTETTASRWLPRLAACGLEAIEQPLPSGQDAGAARVRVGLAMEVVADEALAGPAAAIAVVAAGSASVLSLKPGRDGGLCATRRIAAIGQAAGLGLYGGTMLETSIGTAASAQLYSTMPELSLGTELFGPLRLAHDLTGRPAPVRDGYVEVPRRPGLGIEVDEDLVDFITGRRRSVAVASTN